MAAHQLYFHIAWMTLERRPMIDGATRDFLSDFLRRTAIRERTEVVAIAILQTHVHVLVRSGPRVDLSRLVRLMKGGSSHAANRLAENKLGLRWAREYSATTVSPKSLPKAVHYLETQEQHHPGEGVPR
jgi:REP element-mobilizing transposase RayT